MAPTSRAVNTVCIEPGCPRIAAHRSRCREHATAHEQARGTSTQRGYGYTHQTARRQALAGKTHCPRCGRTYTADNPATGGHITALRDGGDTTIEDQCRTCNYGWRRTGL